MLVEPKQLKSLKLDQPVDVRKLKYFYIRESCEHKCTPVSSELQSAMTKLVFIIFDHILINKNQMKNIYSIQYYSIFIAEQLIILKESPNLNRKKLNCMEPIRRQSYGDIG